MPSHPIGKFQPCPTCCIACTCTSPVPSQYKITIANIATKAYGCADCLSLNGIYYVDWDADYWATYSVCQYVYNFPSAICGVEQVLFQLSSTGKIWEPYLIGPSVYLRMRYTFATTPACDQTGIVATLFSGSVPDCTYASVTATIDAVWT